MKVCIHLLLVSAAMMAAAGCGNEAREDCADCPDPALQPACLEAADACGQFDGSVREQCLQEARDLCESPPLN